MKDLLKAIESEAETPCRKFSCEQFERCANEQLACSSFAYYVHTGRAVHPFNFVTPRKSGEKDRIRWIGEVHPTKGTFDDIQHDRWTNDHTTAWEEKRTAKAQEQTDALFDEIGERNLNNWFALSVERAETTLRRHEEIECQNHNTSTSTPSATPMSPSMSG